MTKKRLLAWIPVILCMAVIFVLSGQSGEESGKVSHGVVELLDPIVEPLYEDLPPPQQVEFLTSFHTLVRKTAHFSIYFLLGAFAFGAFGNYSLPRPLQGACALGLSFLYACSDELHQGLVEGRGPSFTDVLIDTAGAALAILIATWILLIGRKKARTHIL